MEYIQEEAFAWAAYVKDAVFTSKAWFWLPQGFSFDDFQKTETELYPEVEDLLWCLPLAVAIFLIRVFFEHTLLHFLGSRWAGLSTRPQQRAPRDPVLEAAYGKWRKTKSKKPPTPEVTGPLSKQTGRSEKEVLRWFRLKKNENIPPTLVKFKEASWRFLYYFILVCVGFHVLLSKPWFADSKWCWVDFPRQPLSHDVIAYYFVQLSFYISLLISQFFDVRRKDFVEMFIHHCVTIMLLSFSWVCNFVRIGTLVLLVHDVSDVFLESAKLMNYAKRQTLCDALFVAFAVMFFVSRIVVYPYNVIGSVVMESLEVIGRGNWPSRMLFIALLSTLQLLHVFWFSIIARMAYGFVVKGNVEKDDRSDVESAEDDDDDGSGKKKTT